MNQRESEEERLRRALAGDGAAPATDVEALLGRVSARIERERGPVAWLRSRSTPARRGLVLLVAALVLAAVALFHRRVDWGLYPVARLVPELLVLAAVALVALARALRPLFRPATPRPLALALVALGLALPFALGALPQAHALHPASLEGLGADYLSRAAACFRYGLVLSLPVLATLWLVHRRVGGVTALLAAAAAGLVGVFGLQLHCPLTGPAHLLLGHAPVVVALAVLVVSVLAVARRIHR